MLFDRPVGFSTGSKKIAALYLSLYVVNRNNVYLFLDYY